MGAGAWPLMPAWVDVAPGTLRRGERVRARWHAAPPDGCELRLTLVVHHAGRVTWAVPARERPAGAAGALRLRVPPDGPYSYAGTLLAFAWGVALAEAAAPPEAPLGWAALEVLP